MAEETIVTPAVPIQRTVALLTVLRLGFNLNLRMVYPFITVLAQGMGVDITTISLVLSARSLTGIVSLLVIPIADRRGRKWGIAIALLLFTLGLGMMTFWPGLPAFIAAQTLGYLGSFIFIPSVQAYLADTIPYQQRARAVGIVELGWSLSFVIGMPLIAVLIERFGWQSPFPFFFILGVLGLLVVWRLIPDSRTDHEEHSRLFSSLKRIFATPSAVAGLGLYLALGISSEIVMLIFGVWMEDSFGLKIAALGLASAVIGFAELGGETLTATIADRLGKRRVVAVGIVLNGLVALALPWMGRVEAGALAGLFLFFLTFEVAYVTSMPIMTETLPVARATLFGINIALLGLGRAIGDFSAPILYQYGFQANTIACFVLNMLALVALAKIKVGKHV